jgi:hypothetical protein
MMPVQGDDVPDAAADLRSLTDVQRRGLRVAGLLIERLTAAAERDRPGGGRGDVSAGPPGAGRRGPGEPPTGTGWIVDGAAGLAAASMQAFSRAVGTPCRDGAGGRQQEPGLVRLMAGHPELCRADVWLHNTTVGERRDLRLLCTELVSHEGRALAASVRFTPASVERLHPGSSQPVAVAVEAVGHADSPGRYRGTILVTGSPEAWLPIEVVVTG